jgi:hypothetical protein
MSKPGEYDSAGRKTGRRFKTVMAGVGIAIGAMALTGVGIAAFTVTAGGDAAGKVLDADSVKKLMFAANPGPNADLLPGGLGAAQFSVKNDNTFPVTVSRMTLDFNGIVVTKAAGAPAGDCDKSNFTPGPAVSNGNVTVAIKVGANGDSGEQVVKDVFRLSVNAPDACQGATFKIPVTGAAVTSG